MEKKMMKDECGMMSKKMPARLFMIHHSAFTLSCILFILSILVNFSVVSI